MAKRPHGDVERTKEDLDEEFYAGIAQRRLEAGREVQRWGYRPQIILPLPLILPLSGPAKKLPGAEALAAASFATVVHAVRCADHQRVVNASSPEAVAASSSAPAMLDGTASGEDAGTGEAPIPDQDTASGQEELEFVPGEHEQGADWEDSNAGEQILNHDGLGPDEEDATASGQVRGESHGSTDEYIYARGRNGTAAVWDGGRYDVPLVGRRAVGHSAGHRRWDDARPDVKTPCRGAASGRRRHGLRPGSHVEQEDGEERNH